jgi:hypothetical protein
MARKSIGNAAKSIDDPQHGIDLEARVPAQRFAKGDVHVYQTKPGKGRVSSKRMRVVNNLELAFQRGKITQRQLEASRKVEELVKRCSLVAGRGRDSCCMGEVGGGEQSDHSAQLQADAWNEMRRLADLMDPLTWMLLRDVCVGDDTITDWRDTYRRVRRLRLGLTIAAGFWRIPTY